MVLCGRRQAWLFQVSRGFAVGRRGEKRMIMVLLWRGGMTAGAHGVGWISIHGAAVLEKWK